MPVGNLEGKCLAEDVASALHFLSVCLSLPSYFYLFVFSLQNFIP